MLKMTMTVAVWVGVAAFTLGTASEAVAQEENKPGDAVVYKKRTVIDLSGAVIEGELTKPEGSYIVNRKVSRFSSLIKLRENFVPELLASTDML